MPEYVYALHDFRPEHEDEVQFRAGERIEVVERDDLYGDGWWKGKNLAGEVGLFPQSYTAAFIPDSHPNRTTSPAASATAATADISSRSTLQPLQEESEADSPVDPPTNIIAPQPQVQASATFLTEVGANDDKYDGARHQRVVSTGSGEVMKATMTDVQQAIEQLGRGPAVDRDDRSFSFASSKGEHTETEDDYDMSDLDAADADAGGSWHKGARKKLAAKAKRAVEEAEKLEALMNGSASSRRAAPPIDIELSDESEGEGEDGDYTAHSSMPRRHSYIFEDDEEPDVSKHQIRKRTSEQATIREDNLVEVHLSEPHGSEPRTATATQFPHSSDTHTPHLPSSELQVIQEPPSNTSATPVTTDTPPLAAAVTFQESQRESSPYRDSMVALPSPTGSFPSVTQVSPVDKSKYVSVMSNYSVASTASEMSPPLPSSSENTFVEKEKEAQEKSDPSQWTVPEVVDWLKLKGFDQDVCNKFIEQEITGDVLLELDVQLLKTEIGIVAYGKRMRIANAITDLRRPPSIVYSDHPPLPSPQSTQMVTPVRSVSQSHSHHSLPGSASNRGSLGVPGHSTHGSANGYVHGMMAPSESPATDFTVSDAVVSESDLDLSKKAGVGLPANLTNGKTSGRPAQLTLSPSDNALKATATAQAASSINIPEEDENREHMSDGEATNTSIRHRIFRRSHDSTPTSRHSREASLSGVPATPDKDAPRDKERNRHSGGKGGERLSIFGSSFGGTLGKSRKPAPKYPSGLADEGSPDRSSSVFGRARLSHSSSKRVPRPSTPNGTISSKNSPKIRDVSAPAPIPKEIKERDQGTNPSVLRKRTASAPVPPPISPVIGETVVGPLKHGQSVLAQIGDPDHSGWMRKRGERYNNWKLRYFVLKGQHLYWLKSSSTTETKVKGYLSIVGYKVTVDENLNPGKYGFRIEHDYEKTHYFSSDEKVIVRDWMKAIMKATIDRDYTKPVISSCNIPTIPLMVAQAMNPGPRPPSPRAREATQKALRRENPHQLSSRDARVLMGLPSVSGEKEERMRLAGEEARISTVGDVARGDSDKPPTPPVRRDRGPRPGSIAVTSEEKVLIEWANMHLPLALQITDPAGPLCNGLGLLRIAESIKGRPLSPPVPDAAFPTNPNDDKLEGLFRLFDFLLDHDVKMGSVSINDIRQEKRDKIIQLVKALKAWEDKRKAIANVNGSSVNGGSFIAPSTSYLSSTAWS